MSALIGKAVEELGFQESFVLATFQPLQVLNSTAPRLAGEVVGLSLTEVKT